MGEGGGGEWAGCYGITHQLKDETPDFPFINEGTFLMFIG